MDDRDVAVAAEKIASIAIKSILDGKGFAVRSAVFLILVSQ